MHDVQWKCVLVKDTQGRHQFEGLMLAHRMKATIGHTDHLLGTMY